MINGTSRKTYKDPVYTYEDMSDNEVCVGLYLNTKEEVEDYFWPRQSNSTFASNDYIKAALGTGDVTEYYSYNSYGNGYDAKYQYVGENWYATTGSAITSYPSLPYIYKRWRTINTSHATDVVIPSEVEFNGTTYKVTAIDHGGFCFAQNSYYKFDICKNVSQGDGTYKMETEDDKQCWYLALGHNDYLKSITIGSNIKEIGGYAFCGCDGLTSLTIPNNVVSIGDYGFWGCKNLRSLNFQDNGSGTSALRTIGNYTFAQSYYITSIVLPSGITTMGDGAFTYYTSLQSINIPNTVTKVGAHFLCNCSSLPTLTIPATLTQIDGAFLHGCDNLRTLYMLGAAANLNLSDNNYTAFEGNNVNCSEHVNKLEVYVPSNHAAEYDRGAWKQLFNSDVAQAYGISVTALQVETRDFTAGKWVTACFPKGVSASDLSSKFGSGTKVAKFVKAVRLEDAPDPVTGKSLYMYNLIFEMQNYSASGIPKDLPVMFCSEKDVVGFEMWNVSDMTGTGASNFIAGWTKDHNENTTVTAENEDGGNDDIVSQISMKSNYVSRALQPWDFYFSYNNGADDKAKFYRVNKLNDTSAGPTRCWWTVTVGGVVSSSASAKTNAMFFDEASGIDHPEDVVRIGINGVYDTQGRRLDIPASELPHGLFIVNGQKVLIK